MIQKILTSINSIIGCTSCLKTKNKLKTTETDKNTDSIAKKTLIKDEKETKNLSESDKEIKCISLKSPWESSNVNISKHSKDQEILFKLLRGNYEKIHSLAFNGNYFKSLIIKENPELFLEGKTIVKNLFENLFNCLSSSEFDENQTLHFNIIIGELLSLYPYLRPDLNPEPLDVPILINNEWKFIKYIVKEIPFIPKKMPKKFIPLLGSPIVAYGLTPKNVEDKTIAPPLLLFKGTTFPTDKGFSLSLIADFFPFTSVGTFAFWLGEEEIKEWLTEATAHQKALVFGKSLGGSLAFKTTLAFHHFIARTKKYGGPGCSKKELQKIQELSQQKNFPQLDRIIQKNDPIPNIDWIPIAKNVNHYIVISEKERSGFSAHADIYSTHETAGIYLSEPTKKDQYDWGRYKMTLLRDVGSFIFFPILVTLHLVFAVALLGFYRFFQKEVARRGIILY